MNIVQEVLKPVRKFVCSLPSRLFEVETDEGWSKISTINKTVEYEVFEVVLASGARLRCADNHILITSDGREVYAKDSIGMKLFTKWGDDEVVDVKSSGKHENMYDLELGDNTSHLYYTNGILSHNTTTYTIFTLWLATFFPDKRIMICANQLATAIEVMNRIRLAYEYLPYFIKAAVDIYNRGEITFCNKSSIRAFSTSSSSARGFSCVVGSTKVTIIDVSGGIWHTDIDRVDEISSSPDINVIGGLDKKKYKFVYKTVNKVNNNEYIGVHATDNLDDGYLGSGERLALDIEKYGPENFERTILKMFQTDDEAYGIENEDALVEDMCIPLPKVLTEAGFKTFHGVRQITTDRVFCINTSSGNSLMCSPTHRIKLASGDFKEAREVSAGDKLSKGGSVSSVSCKDADQEKVYDLIEVEDGNEYITNGMTSHNCNVLILDELAFVPKGIVDEFFASVMPIVSSSKDSKVIVVSTPNGASGMYYNLWQSAIGKTDNEDGWKPVRIDWFDVPGRDERWKAQQIASFGMDKWRQEFACEFLIGSSIRKLIPDDAIEMHRMRIKDWQARGINRGRYLTITSDEGKTYEFIMWHAFRTDRTYVASGDVAEGTGGDSSVLYIWDITETSKITMCAKFASNRINAVEFAFVADRMLRLYANPYLICESNGVGAPFLDIMRITHEYPSIVKEGKDHGFGVRSHIQLKIKSCVWLRQMFSTEGIGWVLYDLDLIDEMGTFVRRDSKLHAIYEASKGAHDDLVMSLCWAAYMLQPSVVEKYFTVVDYFITGAKQEIAKKISPAFPYEKEDLNFIANDVLYQKFIEDEKMREDIISDQMEQFRRKQEAEEARLHMSEPPKRQETVSVPPAFTYDGKMQNAVLQRMPVDYTPPIVDYPERKSNSTPFFISNRGFGEWTDEDFEGPSWN